MEMANCPRCGKLFTRMSDPICEKCLKEEERLFETVRDYISENPDNRLEEVSTSTGASVKKIIKWMKEGRLETTTAHGELKCERCGKPIRRGKFCDACVVHINHSVADLKNEAELRARTGLQVHTAQKK